MDRRCQGLKRIQLEMRDMRNKVGRDINSMRGRHTTNPRTTRVHDSSSSNSKNENNITRRHTTELAQPEAAPLQEPSRPARAYTAPPTAQARARSRLGYTGTKSALPNTLSPLGGGTAGTGIKPPGYSLHSVQNKIHDAADIDVPAPAVVPAVQPQYQRRKKPQKRQKP
ncbi:hypothetical protein N0V85_001537 [Neurospora sp. IMI 360204]|nr:hypothetical protein N0V85_001537 [Neurospora sp. IMI 360204]